MRISLILTLVCTAVAAPIVGDKKPPSSADQKGDKPGLSWSSGVFGDFHIGVDGVSWHPVHKDGKYDLSHVVPAPSGYTGSAKPGQIVNIPQGSSRGSPNNANPSWGQAPTSNTANPVWEQAAKPGWGPPPSSSGNGWNGPPPSSSSNGWNGPARQNDGWPSIYNNNNGGGKQGGW
ncbi:hypothetical protein FKW77_010458 [Venturia effusa]|uniref:Uncharacterized protein n=1 Tax=Venturia effusa TaxID=50376 RepID=A0A517L2D7_9PEZI|nr:hypothetical protein FKW77_010458 [Venturia effusa]